MTLGIVLVGGQKGGSGKSKIACELAVIWARLGEKVLLVDGDAQATTARFLERRRRTLATGEMDWASPALLKASASVMRQEIAAQIRANGYSKVVIDVAGRDSDEIRVAVMIADFALFPLRPNMEDMDTAERLDVMAGDVLQSSKTLRGAAFVVSQASTNPARRDRVESALTALPRLPNTQTLKTVIHSRSLFEDAGDAGLSVTEMPSSDGKAQAEIMALFDELNTVYEEKELARAE